MGSFSAWHWIIVLVVILIVFGAGKLPKVMGDVAQGVKNFKKGMAEDDTQPEKPAPLAEAAKPEPQPERRQP